jgi:EmrB/QacA subfamily drug resistance transporter
MIKRGRGAALAVLSAGTLMIILSETIVNVALRAIQADLGFDQAALAWVVNAYLVAFGGLLLLAGRVGDLVGRKRVFVAGLALFTAASLASGLARSAEALIVARFAQGVGAALTAAVSLGMIVTLYPEPAGRARAIAAYSFVGAGGASLGVLAGGVLTQVASWHWIFFVNVPIGAVAIVAALRVLRPETGPGLGEGADAPGAVLVTAGLMLGVYTIVTAVGRSTGRTVLLGGAAVALLVAFLVRQATAARPLLPLRIFRSRQVSAANLVQALLVAGMFGFQFLTGLYAQRVLGYGPLATGLAFLPITVVIAAVSLGLSGRLDRRFGPRRVLLAGLVALAAGLALLSRVPVDGRFTVDILPAMLVLGLGGGLALPAVTGLAMSGATERDSGLAAGLANTTVQVGGALGLAVLVAVASARSDALIAAGTTEAAALTSGYQMGFGLGAVLVGAAAVVAGTALRR